MQVASQQTQSPVAQGTYATDPASSRRQYSQQTPQADDQSRITHGRSSPQSSRRPSRRPSGNDNQVNSYDAPYQSSYQSPAGSFPSTSTTPRGQDMANTTRTSPVAPATASSPPHPQSRRDQRAQQAHQSGPPISPPPRTSSNQRSQNQHLPSNAPLSDRTVPSRQTGPEDQRIGVAGQSFDDASASAATAARSRRRGPASPDGPQRAISTREPGQQQSPAAVQSRSASNIASSTPPTRHPRDESQVINRVVVDDPAVDVRREQERQLEAVPGLAVVNNVTADDVKATPRSRQDYSQTSSSGGRRKETRFGEYVLGQTLGEGEFGKVKLGWKKTGEVQVAIKLIRRETLGQNPSRLPKIYREVSILRGLEHPNIVKLHEMIETSPYIGIILEYASGGELFDYILTHRYLKDNTARKLFAQLVSGVGYLHKKGIVHRDLKLENLLLDRNRNIVITDFGFANTFNPDDELEEEIERNLTDRKFVKEMNLDRYLPFDDDPANPEGDNINLLYKYITTTPLTFPEYVTPHARDLLRRILVPDPRQRADLWEVARHSWLLDYQHVVSAITSSTTTVGDIKNTTVTSADQQDGPLLVRSASVREPAKAHPSNISPNALSHQGNVDPEQVAAQSKAPRDPKRRTVQVDPRQSTETRRPSFGFSRKNSDLRQNSDLSKQEKPRRFSLLPASFSFRSFTSAASGKDQGSDVRPASERRQSSSLQQAPASRVSSRPQTMAYNKNPVGNNNYRQEENIPSGFDGQRDRTKGIPGQQARRKEVPSRGNQQIQYGSPQYQSQPDLYPPSRPPQPGQSYLGTPTESEISLGPRRDRPLYPQGFNDFEEEPPRASTQQGRSGGGRPGVLQKNNRKFADAYDQNAEPGYGNGGQHAGSSGAAKRVMDFFRRRGKARSGDERI
ncbi:hypothetical protein P7C71_g655, partial [Lecanoromycetidae sp. Uapishka_2]